MSDLQNYEGKTVRLQMIDLEQDGKLESEGAFCQGSLALISLSRPDRANAFDDHMITELIDLLNKVELHAHKIRLLIVHGLGPHFCAGADLGWMQRASRLTYEENIDDAALLSELFSKLKNIGVPTLGLVHGSVMGGGVGLAACLDLVVATEDAKFALSEVKLGLAPAVIMPFLHAKVQPGFLRQYALSGQVFTAQKAYEQGLVQLVAPPSEKAQFLISMADTLLQGSPTAQRAIKQYLNILDGFVPETQDESWTPVSLIARLRTSVEGQQGLAAFFGKSRAPWRLHSNWQKSIFDTINQDHLK